jgi:hypothetical protein
MTSGEISHNILVTSKLTRIQIVLNKSNPFEDSEISVRMLRTGGTGRAISLEDIRLQRQKETDAPEALRARFTCMHGPLGLDFGSC